MINQYTTTPDTASVSIATNYLGNKTLTINDGTNIDEIKFTSLYSLKNNFVDALRDIRENYNNEVGYLKYTNQFYWFNIYNKIRTLIKSEAS